jgi:hypothetical protein
VHVLTMQHKIFHALSFFDKGVGARWWPVEDLREELA